MRKIFLFGFFLIFVVSLFIFSQYSNDPVLKQIEQTVNQSLKDQGLGRILFFHTAKRGGDGPVNFWFSFREYLLGEEYIKAVTSAVILAGKMTQDVEWEQGQVFIDHIDYDERGAAGVRFTDCRKALTIKNLAERRKFVKSIIKYPD